MLVCVREVCEDQWCLCAYGHQMLQTACSYRGTQKEIFTFIFVLFLLYIYLSKLSWSSSEKADFSLVMDAVLLQSYSPLKGWSFLTVEQVGIQICLHPIKNLLNINKSPPYICLYLHISMIHFIVQKISHSFHFISTLKSNSISSTVWAKYDTIWRHCFWVCSFCLVSVFF